MYCPDARIRGVIAAVPFLAHRLSTLFQQAINLLPPYRDPNPTEATLPVHRGSGVSLPTECNGDEKVTSWAKVNLALSFSAGLAVLSVPSSFINKQFTSVATYAIGVYVAFLLSLAVYLLSIYCMPSCLHKTVKITILSISSAIISVAYGLVLLKVVVCKGATW